MDAQQDGSPDTDSEDPLLIVCGRCGHPNLEFRNHCRRCGAPLRGSANIIPGVELFEWTATDGPQRRYRPTALGWPLLLLIAACVAIPSLMLAGMSAAALLAVPGVLLIGVAYWLLRRSHGADAADGLEEREEAAAPERPAGGEVCPTCGACISPEDDICPACCAVVASDVPGI